MEEEKDVQISDPFHWIHRKDQTITLFEWEGLQSVLVIVYTLIMGITNIVCKVLIINYIWRYAPKDRPINNMMLVEQVKEFPLCFCSVFLFSFFLNQIMEMISFIVFFLMFIISMGNGQPVSSVMGYDSCVIYYTAICIHNWAQVMGGFGMALYRLQCIKTPTRRVPSKWFVFGQLAYVGIGLGIGKT